MHDGWSVWSLTLYPGAGEAGGALVSRSGRGERPEVPDSARSEAEAARRARGTVRRYCAANRLNRFGTLTYAGEGCHDPLELRGHVAGFFRQLRGGLGCVPLPYAWAAEWHPGGHGLHVHFAVGRYVPHHLIRDVWGRGRIHIKLIGDLPVGAGALEEARKAGSYLGKYVGKAFDARLRQAGLHRYEVAQGFQPEEERLTGSTVDHVIRQASALMGSEPERVWRSSREEGWERPPAVWCAWGG